MVNKQFTMELNRYSEIINMNWLPKLDALIFFVGIQWQHITLSDTRPQLFYLS